MIDFAFTGYQIMGLLVLLSIAISMLVLYWKHRLNFIKDAAIISNTNAHPILERNKLKQLQLNHKRPKIFLISFTISLSIVLIVFQLTTFNPFTIPESYELELNEMITIEEPPRTGDPKPEFTPAVKKQNQVIIEPIDHLDSIFETDTFSLFVVEPINPFIYLPDTANQTTAMAPIIPDQDIDELHEIVEYMPLFPGCNLTEMTYEEKKLCSDKNFLTFIYKEIRYPKIAGTSQIEGTVIVQFVVERNGSISKPEVLRNPGGGLGQEALRIVNLMIEQEEKWSPGIMNHRQVRVVMRLPIRFRLTD